MSGRKLRREWLDDLGTLPNVLGMLGVLLDDGKDTRSDDAMGAAEVVVDFWGSRLVLCL